LTYVLDTNIFIAALNGSVWVLRRLDALSPEEVVLCAPVLAELEYGLIRRRSSIPNPGMILPEMGTVDSRSKGGGLAGALFTPVQQRVLGLLFGQPERRFQSAELIRLAGSGTGAVYRQLQRLAATRLVVVTREGNQKYYQANRSSPIYLELHGLAVKTMGVVEPLRAALEPLARRITAAFVFGSVAKGSDHAGSDLDLLVVGDDLEYADVYPVLEKAESRLGRPVNPTVMSRAEWKQKRARRDTFATRIAAQPKLFVMGSEDALR
jgi:predicted nucleotidyltransferase